MGCIQEVPDSQEGTKLRRTLKKRHLLMMSLGGTIGTGLFIGIAEPLHSVGPLGTLLAYLIAGGIMMMTMMCLGELSCAFPHSGSFQHYALKFLPHPIWSYTIGWLYWLSWVFSLAADLTKQDIFRLRGLLGTLPGSYKSPSQPPGLPLTTFTCQISEAICYRFRVHGCGSKHTI